MRIGAVDANGVGWTGHVQTVVGAPFTARSSESGRTQAFDAIGSGDARAAIGAGIGLARLRIEHLFKDANAKHTSR